MVDKSKKNTLIVFFLCLYLLLTGCARREPDAPDNSVRINDRNNLTKISCDDLLKSNDKHLFKEYDCGGEKLTVDADIRISDSLYKGKTQKIKYDLTDIETILNKKIDWADNQNGSYYNNDSREKIYIDDIHLDYDNLKERDALSDKGVSIYKNENDYSTQEKNHIEKLLDSINELLGAIGLETDYYMSHIEYYGSTRCDYIYLTRTINDVKVFDDYCAYESIYVIESDNQILSISMLPGYIIDDPEKVSEVIDPKTIIDMIGNNYSSGKLAIDNIVRIELVYYVNNKNEIIPAWSVSKTMGNGNYVCALCFNAETGELLKDYIGCWRE